MSLTESWTTTSTQVGATGHNPYAGPEPTFDPAVHLAYQPPAERLTMDQLGLGDVPTPSPIAVTSPFPLASFEGVKALRNSILQPACIDRHMMQSELAGPHLQLRGMAPHAAKLLYEFWTHPDTLRSLCEAAGEDLIPVFDLELGHTNIQVPENDTRESYIRKIHPDPFHNKNNSIAGNTLTTTSSSSSTNTVTDEDEADIPMVVDFHRDAYPWVAVLMLSDISNMVGGETALRIGDGSLFKARGPNLGSCVMMQGGYISHAALPCRPQPGTTAAASPASNERITMVTSFRKRSAVGWRDISNLTNIRSCSNWNELYAQWVDSRLAIIDEKVRGFKDLVARRKAEQEARGRGGVGGLQLPVVTKGEVDALREEIEDHFTRALDEMKPYGDASDRWTPRAPAASTSGPAGVIFAKSSL